MMDDVGVIAEIMGYFPDLAKIIQAGIGKLRQPFGSVGGEIVDDLQRRARRVAHRDELQDGVGRKINVEFDVRVVRDQADRIAFEIPDHRVIVVAEAQIRAARGGRDIRE